jgi:ribosomal protein L7/L12
MPWVWAAGVALVVVLGIASRMGEWGGSGGASSGPPSPERIDELLRAGRKIEAIKAYRALHAVDLKAAKDAVDARARQLGR